MINYNLTFTNLEKKLKSEQNSLRNHLLSIKHDEQFVEQMINFFPSYPVYCNLRNGRWYHKTFSGSCYFKSTDGHDGYECFSTTRLNLNTLKAAVSSDGLIIVDSTRRGKRFPDSFTTTIPIWIAVINAVAADHIDNFNSFFTSPAWMSSRQRDLICKSLQSYLLSDGFSTYRQLIHDEIKRLPQDKFKPLRPIWACVHRDDSIEWMSNEIEDILEHLDKTKIMSSLSTTTLSSNDTYISSLPYIPIILFSCSAARTTEDAVQWRNQHSWYYIQGAGDDDENWSAGLTPELFWTHCDQLLADNNADPVQLHALVRSLLTLAHSQPNSHRQPQPQLSTNLCIAAQQEELVNYSSIWNGSTATDKPLDQKNDSNSLSSVKTIISTGIGPDNLIEHIIAVSGTSVLVAPLAAIISVTNSKWDTACNFSLNSQPNCLSSNSKFRMKFNLNSTCRDAFDYIHLGGLIIICSVLPTQPTPSTTSTSESACSGDTFHTTGASIENSYVYSQDGSILFVRASSDKHMKAFMIKNCTQHILPECLKFISSKITSNSCSTLTKDNTLIQDDDSRHNETSASAPAEDKTKTNESAYGKRVLLVGDDWGVLTLIAAAATLISSPSQVNQGTATPGGCGQSDSNSGNLPTRRTCQMRFWSRSGRLLPRDANKTSIITKSDVKLALARMQTLSPSLQCCRNTTKLLIAFFTSETISA